MRFSILTSIMLFSILSFSQQSNKLNASVTLVSQDNTSITLKMKAPSFTVKPINNGNKNYDKIFLRGAVYCLEAGMPEVMQLSRSIIIPNNGSTTIEVLSSSFTDVQNINLVPSKGNLTRDIDPSTINYKEGTQYNKNEFYPAQTATIRDPYIFGNMRGQTTVFYPFQYNAVTNVLRVYDEIIVKINFNQFAGVNELISSNPSSVDQEFSAIYSGHFLNFNPAKYTPLNENGKMLVIADQSFMSAMQPFVNWKNRSGRQTEMVSIQSIGNNSDSIKSYIQQYYNTKGLAYVLLVGDNMQVTPKMLSSTTASDNYYGYLAGSDSYPEVFIGRFSSETVAHVQTQVNRTLDYETFNNQISNYYSKGIGLASQEGPGDDNEYDYQHVRNMRTDLLAYNYTAVSELYEGSQGGVDAVGNPSASMVTNELNDGKGILLYTGHGSSQSFGTSGFSSTNVAALNNVGKLPLVWAVACVNGEFVNQTCFAEKWLRSVNSQGQAVGAVATLMSTINQSWNPPMDAQDEMVDLLVESYTSNIKRTFGGLSMNGCMHMNDQYGSGGADMTDTWTIFGDPSLMVRTSTPNQIYASHPPTINTGLSSITVNVSHNNVLVAFSVNDSLITTAVPSNNVAILNFNPIVSVDTFDIVITGYNLIPYQGIVVSSPSQAPYITSDLVKVNDIQANNNSKLDNGETTYIGVRLKNLGSLSTNSVTVALSCNNQFITLIDSTENFGNFLPGDTISILNAFQVLVSNNIPDQTNVMFGLQITDANGNSWNPAFSLIANAPILEIESYQISESTGNGDGKFDAGETLELAMQVKNTGHNKINNSIGSINSNSLLINNISLPQNISTIEIDSSTTLSFDFDIANTAIAGDMAVLIAKVINGLLGDSISLEFRVGIFTEDFETSDFSKYSWLNISSKPWKIDSNVYYDGANSAKSGLGTNDDNESSILQLDINVASNDSIIFFMKVSSEDGSAYGQYWDFLEFFVDVNSMGKWQGEIDWTRYAFPIQAGLRELTWIYQKDQVESYGDDCAWIDLIVLPPLVDNSSIGNDIFVKSFNVFPNPIENTISFEITSTMKMEGRIIITNLDGKIVLNDEIVKVVAGVNKFSTNTSVLSSGIYNITFITNDQSITRKIVKF